MSGQTRRIAVVFGTRPEAIKLAPVIEQLKESAGFEPMVIITAQHRAMLDDVLGFFGLRPDHDLDLFRPGHTLEEILAGVVSGLGPLLAEHRPDLVLVQGDTTTTLSSALAAFYQRLPVGHVEAGLRTYDPMAPYPEEINRRLTSHVAALHFAPTERSRLNLLREGIPSESVLVTGNTVIDALAMALERPPGPVVDRLAGGERRRLILVTAHRRESWGDGLREVAAALAELAEDPGDRIVFPVHGNPEVRAMMAPSLDRFPNVVLTDPLAYGDFVHLMARADCILTDSGGLQEEAPFLGRPVLVLRKVTERPEAIEGGAAHLVGTSRETIVGFARKVLADPGAFTPPDRFLFGDGHAAERIVSRLAAFLGAGGFPA